MLTADKRLRLATVIRTIDPYKGIDPVIAKQLRSILNDIPRIFDNRITPHSQRTEQLASAVEALAEFINDELTGIRSQSTELDTRYGKQSKKLKTSLEALIKASLTKYDKQLGELMKARAEDGTVLTTSLGKIRQDVEDLFWARTLNGSNNVQAVLNIKSAGAAVAQNVNALNFKSGFTVVVNADNSIDLTSTGSVTTNYTETPTGAIDGSNKTYTTAHTITTVFSFAINGTFLHPTTDYTFTGSTITMVTALPVELSGKPFTIVYA